MLTRWLRFAARALAACSLGLLILLAGCRESSTAWTRCYCGEDFVSNQPSVIAAELNTCLIACMTKDSARHARLIQVSDLGDSLWSADVTAGEFVSLCRLPAGGFVAAGSKRTEHRDDALLVRGTDQKILWSRTYRRSGSVFADVQATRDGGFVACGFSRSLSQGKRRDLFVARTDSAGDTLWTRVFESPGNQGWFRVVQTPDSGFAVVVSSYMVETDQPHQIKLRLLRLDQNGNRLWERFYGPEWSVEAPHFVAQDSGLVICASQRTALRKDGTCNYRIYLLKVDAHGDTLWTRTYGDEKRESLLAGSILAASDGYIIAGTDWSIACPFLMKISLQGDSSWIKRFDPGIKTNYFVSAALTNDGACVLTAEGMPYDRKKRDYLPRGLVVMKTKPLPSR